jgi:hypothetical protein
MKFTYSQDYFPPVPIAEVTFITAAELLRTEPLEAIIDTSADGTIVPISYLDEILATPTVEMTMRSQWGERRHVLLYLVDVQVGEITLPGIEVVGDEQSNEIILGRDVLNHLHVLLNGPANSTTISE